MLYPEMRTGRIKVFLNVSTTGICCPPLWTNCLGGEVRCIVLALSRPSSSWFQQMCHPIFDHFRVLKNQTVITPFVIEG